MWRKIKGPVITICIMHLTALLCLIILSIVQCFVDMAEWIQFALAMAVNIVAVSYTHLRAHETDSYLVCRLLLEKKK